MAFMGAGYQPGAGVEQEGYPRGMREAQGDNAKSSAIFV